MLTDIKVGLSCNNACVHCVMAPTKDAQQSAGQALDSDTATIKSLIERAACNGFSHITLTGGEVTVRRDFPELVEFALSKKLFVAIQTNGRLLTKPKLQEFLSRISDRERLQFVVAVHGDIAALHDSITRRKGSFGQTIRAIQFLRSAEFGVCGKFVLSKLNLSALPATLKLLQQLDVSDCVVAFPHAEDFTNAAFQEVVPRYEAVAEAIRGVLAIDANMVPASVTYETVPYCVLEDIRFWRSNLDLVLLRERLLASETLIQMSMTGQTIDWNASRIQIKTKPPQCTHCLLDRICEGPWAEYVSHFGVAEFTPLTNEVSVQQFLDRL